jgi:hypothetical protein
MRRKRLLTCIAVTAAVTGAALPAWAYVTATTATVSPSIQAQSILPPNGASAAATTGSTTSSITVSVTAGPGASSAPPSGYRVDRVSPAAAGVCYISGTTGSCNDTGLSSGTSYSYNIFSVIGSNLTNSSTRTVTWTSSSSALAGASTAVVNTVTIDKLNGTGYTNSQAPALSGTSNTNGPVTLKLCSGNVSTVCTTPAQTLTTTPTGSSGSFTWSKTPASLAANQTWSLFATQANGTSANTTFVIDTTAPAPTITASTVTSSNGSGSASGTQGSQQADATHSADQTVTIEICSTFGTVSCTSLGSPVVTSTAGGATWSVTWSGLSTANPDHYTINVRQTDAAGNTSTVTANSSNSVNFSG